MLLKGLDPWVQWRSAEYLNEHGLREFLNWYDQTSWYPFGKAMGKTLYIVIPLTGVILYKIAIFLGIKTSLFAVTYFTPAIFGAATIIVIYKLGEIVHSKRTGIFAAFFLTLANGFLSRTIVGFYDNECVGIFLMFLCFYFFVRGLVKDSMLSNIMAGICLGGLTITWGAYKYGYNLLALYAVLMIFLKKYTRRLLTTYSITIVLGLFIGALIPRNGIKYLFATEQLISLLVVVGMLFITIYQELQKNIAAEKLKKIVRYSILGVVGAGIIGIIILYALGSISPIAAKFIRTIIPTLKESIPLIESVAENLTSSWANLFFNIYIMVFLLPLGFYFCIRKPNEKTIFLLLMGLTGVYFGASMVRLSLIVTPAAAVVAGYTLDEVLRPFALINQERFTISRRKRRAAKQIGKELIAVAYIFVAVTLLLTVVFGGLMLERQYYKSHELTLPIISGNERILTHDYQETFDFVRVNIAPYQPGEKPPIMLSWWDYGYQLRALGNITTLVDNATINSTQIGVVGAMLIHNVTTSVQLMKKFGVDYVLVLSPGTIGNSGNDIYKSQWMMKIAETEASQYLHEYGLFYEDYFNEDTSVPEEYGFTDKFWDSVIYILTANDLNAPTGGLSYGTYGGIEGGAPVQNWRTTSLLQNAPDRGFTHLDGKFRLVFQSSHAILRIYEVTY
jgi:dolichyl-diphosphooligosaccharide--protein glycosyltransferase